MALLTRKALRGKYLVAGFDAVSANDVVLRRMLPLVVIMPCCVLLLLRASNVSASSLYEHSLSLASSLGLHHFDASLPACLPSPRRQPSPFSIYRAPHPKSGLHVSGAIDRSPFLLHPYLARPRFRCLRTCRVSSAIALFLQQLSCSGFSPPQQ